MNLMEFLTLMILYVTAIKEYEFLYEGRLPASMKDYTINIWDRTRAILLKYPQGGELMAFSYSLAFIFLNFNLLFYYTHQPVKHPSYIFKYTIIVGVIVFLHFYVPYYFTVLKNSISAITLGIPFKDYLLNKYKTIKRDKVGEVKCDTTLFKIPTNYLEYKNLVKKIYPQGSPLPYKEYIKVAPFLNGYNIFVHDPLLKNVEILVEDDKCNIHKYSFEYKSMYYALHKSVDLNLDILTRFVEATIYIGVFVYLRSI